jgi:hypothetical protein
MTVLFSVGCVSTGGSGTLLEVAPYDAPAYEPYAKYGSSRLRWKELKKSEV